jgi:hypothetical protein
MNLTIKAGLFALVVAASASLSVGTQAQEVACSSSGSMVFNGLAERRAEIVPSVHRQLSGLGRLAAANNCSIIITCASDPANGKDANSIRNRQCSAARQAIGMFERRSDVRRTLTDSYEIQRVSAGKGAAAGQVIVTLQ